MAYKEIGQNNIWIPKLGESLEGEVKQKKAGAYGEQWVLQTKSGEQFVTPSHKVLQSRMQDVKVGDKIKIVLEKIDPPSQKGFNPTQIYKVYRDE